MTAFKTARPSPKTTPRHGRPIMRRQNPTPRDGGAAPTLSPAMAGIVPLTSAGYEEGSPAGSWIAYYDQDGLPLWWNNATGEWTYSLFSVTPHGMHPHHHPTTSQQQQQKQQQQQYGHATSPFTKSSGGSPTTTLSPFNHGSPVSPLNNTNNNSRYNVHPTPYLTLPSAVYHHQNATVYTPPTSVGFAPPTPNNFDRRSPASAAAVPSPVIIPPPTGVSPSVHTPFFGGSGYPSPGVFEASPPVGASTAVTEAATEGTDSSSQSVESDAVAAAGLLSSTNPTLSGFSEISTAATVANGGDGGSQQHRKHQSLPLFTEHLQLPPPPPSPATLWEECRDDGGSRYWRNVTNGRTLKEDPYE